MSIFDSLFGSGRSKKVKEISDKLNSLTNESPKDIADNFFEYMQNSDQGEEELFDFVMQSEDLKAILEINGMGRSEMEEVFRTLERGGAGQMVNGYYVAGAALCFEESLEYLLSNYNKLCGEEASKESILTASHKMVKHFE
jgi:hypothetical protein